MNEDWKILAVEGQHNQQKANPKPTRGALPPTNAHLAYHLPAVDLFESGTKGHIAQALSVNSQAPCGCLIFPVEVMRVMR